MFSSGSILLFFFFFMTPPPPTSTLFPYTTLFRSVLGAFAFSRVVTRRPALARTSDTSTQEKRESPFACDLDRKSTRLNSSHVSISYAVFCLKKKTTIDKISENLRLRALPNRTLQT